jgi:hypothetical protein
MVAEGRQRDPVPVAARHGEGCVGEDGGPAGNGLRELDPPVRVDDERVVRGVRADACEYPTARAPLAGATGRTLVLEVVDEQRRCRRRDTGPGEAGQQDSGHHRRDAPPPPPPPPPHSAPSLVRKAHSLDRLAWSWLLSRLSMCGMAARMSLPGCNDVLLQPLGRRVHPDGTETVPERVQGDGRRSSRRRRRCVPARCCAPAALLTG